MASKERGVGIVGEMRIIALTTEEIHGARHAG
jgi:hypothetical protein